MTRAIIKSQRRFFNKFRRFLIGGGLLLALLIFWSPSIKKGAINLFSQRHKLEVDFLDVGQGDAELIKTPGGQVILIDGGPDDKILRRLGDSLPFYRRQIDWLIFSHYHEDHVAGLVAIMKRYRVKKLIYADNGAAMTVTAKILISEAKDKATPITLINNQAAVPLGDDCDLTLFNPAALGVKIDPNNSLIVKLDCQGEKFLFSGDNSAAIEKALLASGLDLNVDVLKASHHGSNSANSEAFLRAASPELLVIPVGTDNKFGHPHPKVLERAAALDIDVKRTDKDGNIKIFRP
jgi:competence protein ComEC